MDDRRKFESVFSEKIRAGKRRTYFFDVRQTRGEDYYLTITESTRRFNGDGYERHKIFLYKEDFNRFMAGLNKAINHVKTDLLPDYDYDEYTRRHEEYEAKRAAEDAAEAAGISTTPVDDAIPEQTDSPIDSPKPDSEPPSEPSEPVDEDDMKW